MAPLQLVLLGGFHASAAGQEIDVPGRKERALLAFLAIPAGEARSRDKLAGLLWSDRGDSQARESLKQAVFKLRKSLDCVRPSPLLADREFVSLEKAAVTVDVAEFEQLIGEGTMEALARAAALYRGDLLDGLDLRDAAFDEWLLMERQRLRDLAREALAKLVDRQMAGGAHDQAAEAARRLLSLDPLREAAHRALMQIYAAQGQTALALKQYQLCRDALQGELGVKPEAETERLYRSIQEKRTAARRAPDHAPVEHVAAEASSQPDESSSHRIAGVAPTTVKPSIAVLPFSNLGADPEQQYLSDGITEDIITELSRFGSLFVIARNSSFQFRGLSVDIAAVRNKLGVRYVVEGSIRKVGARIQLTARLIDAVTERHIWAERYDREVEDIFAVQDDLTRAIAATLEGRVAASGAEQAKRRPTTDWAAYDYFLQGREQYNRYDFIAAEPFFARAVQLDPGFARAYALWAQSLLVQYWNDLQAETMERAVDYARKALSLDDTDPWCHAVMAFILMLRGHRDLAGFHFDRSVALNPTDVQIASLRALWVARMGRPNEALEILDVAMHRDPFPPAWIWEVRGIALLHARRYEDVIDSVSRIGNKYAWDHAYIAVCHAYLNRPAEARAAASEVLKVDPHFTVSRYAQVEAYTAPADLKHLLDGMRKAGLPE